MSPSKKEEEIFDFDAVTAEAFDAARPLREAALQRRKEREALDRLELARLRLVSGPKFRAYVAAHSIAWRSGRHPPTSHPDLLAEKLQTRSIQTLHLVSFQGVRSSLWCPRRGQSDRDIMNTCIQRTRGLLENR